MSCKSNLLKSICFGTRLHAMSHSWVLAGSQACTSPNKICHKDKTLISLMHSLFRQNSSSGCGRNVELGLEPVSAQVRNEFSVYNLDLNLHPYCARRPQIFESRFLVWVLFGAESVLCLQADSDIPLISSHPFCLIPGADRLAFL